eukprot:scaffold285607_cov15-Tisochrysis_lutea.AAC.1
MPVNKVRALEGQIVKVETGRNKALVPQKCCLPFTTAGRSQRKSIPTASPGLACSVLRKGH